MSVREYVQEFPSCAFRTYLFYCPETFDAEAFAFNIQQAFNGLEFIEGKIDMYVVPDEDSLGKIQNYLETHDQMYDEFKDIADSYYKGSIEFKFGSLEHVIRRNSGNGKIAMGYVYNDARDDAGNTTCVF